MPVELTNLSDIDQAQLADNEAFLVEALLEQFPYLDLNQKVLRQILVRPEAMLRTLGKENTDRIRNSFSLPAMLADPTAADDDTVESIIGNFLITRRQGYAAAGQVVIVLNTLVTTPLSGSVILTANSQEFRVTQPFIGVVNAENVVAARDRLITSRGDGTYAFTVDVVATAVGVAGQVRQGTTFTLSPPIANMTKAYAESDFNQGADAETTPELLSRFSEGVAAQSTADRIAIASIIRKAFAQVVDISIIGAGDPEMRRDGHNLFGLKTGGRSDIYVRTTTLPSLIKVTKEATLVNKADGVWQASFSRSEVPGFYRAEKVVLAGADILGGYTVLLDSRAADVTAPNQEYVPYIGDAAEAVYSPYQTVLLQFADTDTPTGSLIENVSKQAYDFYVRALTNLDEIQSFIGSRGRCDPNGDYLIRAPMPCFVSVGIKIQYKVGTEVPAVKPIQDAIAALVNSVPFSVSRLSVSRIIEVVHGIVAPNGFVDLPVDLRGTIRTQEGTELYLRSTDALEVATQAQLSLSRRTTTFYLNPDDVNVTIVPATGYLPV